MFQPIPPLIPSIPFSHAIAQKPVSAPLRQPPAAMEWAGRRRVRLPFSIVPIGV